MDTELILYISAVFVLTMIGGTISLIRPWTDEWLHLFISFGAGIFIGTVFLHLLPEAYSDAEHFSGSIYVLLGFLLIFFIEKFLSGKGDQSYEHSHMVTSIVAMLGLSVHSLFDGLALVTSAFNERIGTLILVSVIAHKIPAAFSLTSLFILAKLPRSKAFGLLTVFALMTPLGAILFSPFFEAGGEQMVRIITAITAGTFLYVSVGELLPEVFHGRKKRWIKLALMISGIIVMGIVGQFLHSGHNH